MILDEKEESSIVKLLVGKGRQAGQAGGRHSNSSESANDYKSYPVFDDDTHLYFWDEK